MFASSLFASQLLASSEERPFKHGLDGRHPLAVLVALASVLLLPASAGAEQPESGRASYANAASLSEPSELVIESELPTRALSLDAALALAVKHNLGVEVARYEPMIAEQDMEGAWGAYDPLLAGSFGYELSEAPNTFSLNNARVNQQRRLDGQASLNTLLPYLGSTIGVEWNTARARTNSGVESLSPKYDSSVFLTAKIPLLRGLIWNQAWTAVKVSKINYGTSDDVFRASVMDIVESTINAYWNLVATHEQSIVAQKSLETALALLDQTQTQFEVGVVSKVEVVEAEAGVADREFSLISARNDFENSGDILIDAVLGRELKSSMNFRIDPADDPQDYRNRDVDVERAVATALAKLPELRAAEREIEQRDIELKFAKNARLPQFDVEGRYGYANVSGDANVRNVFGQAQNAGSYNSSYDELFTEDGFENYSVRGIISIPLPNRTARREVAKNQIELRRAHTRKARTTQDVILSVRSAARGLLASSQGIEAAERRRLAAEEQLRAERIRLEHGESTPFEVLQRESDLVDAESQKIGALQSYRAAEARLERAQGTILDTYRIEIDDTYADARR